MRFSLKKPSAAVNAGGGAHVVALDVAEDAERLIRASRPQSAAGIEAAHNIVRLAGRRAMGRGGREPR